MAQLLRKAVSFLGGRVIIEQDQPGVGISMADVVRRFGPSYQARYGIRMPWLHGKALEAIESCRTAAMGGHVLECTDCKVQDYAYHSCRHRACPKCMRDDAEAWVQGRMREALPVPHFHVVFNIPKQIHKLVRENQRLLYPAVMRAAAAALLEVGADEAHLGGEIGVLTTLHTWSRKLLYHPHVHCLVTAGCLDSHGRWRPAPKSSLAPEEILAERFRSHVLDLISEALERAPVPSADPIRAWPVFVRLATESETVLRYLAKTLYTGPLSEHQLKALTDSGVELLYDDLDQGRRRKVQVEGIEFLRRFLQHVWPRGVHRVQYHGLWSRKSRAKRERLKAELAATDQAMLPEVCDTPALNSDDSPASTWIRCPHCGGLRAIRKRFSRNATLPVLIRPAPQTAAEAARPP